MEEAAPRVCSRSEYWLYRWRAVGCDRLRRQVVCRRGATSHRGSSPAERSASEGRGCLLIRSASGAEAKHAVPSPKLPIDDPGRTTGPRGRGISPRRRNLPPPVVSCGCRPSGDVSGGRVTRGTTLDEAKTCGEPPGGRRTAWPPPRSEERQGAGREDKATAARGKVGKKCKRP